VSNAMLILRKIMSAAGSAIMVSIMMAWLMKDVWDAGMLSWLLIVPIYTFPVLLFYGLPVSLFSDLVTKRLGKFRSAAACLVHLAFGFVFMIIVGLCFGARVLSEINWIDLITDRFVLAATAGAGLYWAIDELLSFKLFKRKG